MNKKKAKVEKRQTDDNGLEIKKGNKRAQRNHQLQEITRTEERKKTKNEMKTKHEEN